GTMLCRYLRTMDIQNDSGLGLTERCGEPVGRRSCSPGWEPAEPVGTRGYQATPTSPNPAKGDASRLTAAVLPEMLAAVNVSVPPVEPHQRSLSEVHSSVEIPRQLSFWRRFFAFSGPAYLISVGYMDPGNWATDIAAGSKFGYGLLWVLVMSNIMAILLQSLSARLGIVTGMDLAQ